MADAPELNTLLDNARYKATVNITMQLVVDGMKLFDPIDQGTLETNEMSATELNEFLSKIGDEIYECYEVAGE